MKKEVDLPGYYEMWRNKTKELVARNIDGEVWNENMALWLESLIPEAKTAYYKGYPIYEDKVYDTIEKDLERLKPESPLLEKVGHDLEE